MNKLSRYKILFQRTFFPSVVAGVFSLMFSACSTQTATQQQTPGAQHFVPQNAVVTVGSTEGVISSETPLSWFAKDFIYLEDAQNLKADEADLITVFVKKKISEYFLQKGYQIKPEVGSTRYQVVVAGASSSASTDQLHDLFRIYPGLSNQGLKRGALMLGIVDTARNISVWRGVLEGPVSEGLPLEQRLQRLEAVIFDLMSRMKL